MHCLFFGFVKRRDWLAVVAVEEGIGFGEVFGFHLEVERKIKDISSGGMY